MKALWNSKVAPPHHPKKRVESHLTRRPVYKLAPSIVVSVSQEEEAKSTIDWVANLPRATGVSRALRARNPKKV